MLNGPSSKKIWLMHMVTLGLYFFYWCGRSRRDIQGAAGQHAIPPTWYLAIPGLSYYWVWLYAAELERVSFKRIRGNDVFLVYVIGANFIFIALSFFQFLTPTPDYSPSRQTILALIGIAVLVLLLITAGGLAFFCSYVQKRVTALKP